MTGKREWITPEIKVVEREEMKLRHKEFCTNSVLNFLKENNELIDEYLVDVREKGKIPNYSDFLRTIQGTTAEKVNLASIYVVRSRCTEYLQSRYFERYGRDE